MLVYSVAARVSTSFSIGRNSEFSLSSEPGSKYKITN